MGSLSVEFGSDRWRRRVRMGVRSSALSAGHDKMVGQVVGQGTTYPCTIPAQDVAVPVGRGRIRRTRVDNGGGREQVRRTEPDQPDVGVKS